MFKLENVCYKKVLNINHLTINPGKTTAIIGESGSGKTTLLKLLNHMIDYNQGTIIYHSTDLKNLDAVMLRREVIMVPQAPVIFPGTIRDNLLIGLNFAKKELVSDDKLLDELSRVGLSKNLEEDIEPLSGGEKQRIALARVMLMEPQVLLLDEPTSALDEETERKILSYIKQYLESGDKTIVLVTHSKQLARTIGNTIVTVTNGRITAIEEVA